jgi:lipopolysaccharide heptosyltransferase II
MGPRILIVNANWLGDVLFSTPALRALRKKFPEAHLACLAPARCAEVLRGNPHLDEVILCTDRDTVLSWPEFARVAWKLRKKRFDTVLFFHRSKTKALLARLAGIPERIGARSASGLHRTDETLGMLASLGIPDDGRAPEFIPSEEARSRSAALLAEAGMAGNDPFVVVHAGGNWDLKRWPAAHFTEWMRLFLEHFPHKVILCGTAAESALCDEIRRPFDVRRVVSLCGRTTLGELAAVLGRAELLLSNDSGPIHLAASQRTPLVGLFGPTSPERTGPVSEGAVRIIQKDVGCQVPCYFRSCDHRVCMEWLSPREVFERTKELLGETVSR